MKVYVLAEVYGSQVVGVYGSFDLAVQDINDELLESGDEKYTITEYEVQEEEETPQKIQVVYEHWGSNPPWITAANRGN